MDVLLVLEGWVEDRGNVSRRGPHTDSGSGLKGGAAANRGTALHQWAFSTSVHVHARAARRNTIGGQKRQPFPLTYKRKKVLMSSHIHLFKISQMGVRKVVKSE